MAEDEDLVCNGNNHEADFDRIVGYIEDIIIDPRFIQMQQTFMEEHYEFFEEGDENKLEYMDIFKAYTDLIEKHIEKSLIKNVPGFSMKHFQEELVSKQSELEGEIFEILVSFTDFVSFKELLLDYKAAKKGDIPDLSIVTQGYRNGL